MPKKIRHKASPLSSRKGSNGRKNRKGHGRPESGGSETGAPRVIANSLFALTLKDKPGIEIENKTTDNNFRRISSYLAEDDYDQMYQDLLACFKNAVKVVLKERTGFDPLASGLGIGAALYYVTDGFKNQICPKGFKVNIDREDNEYFFTIFTECSYGDFWHFFEIRHVVEYLYKHNKKLHNLFLVFIKSFSVCCGIDFWFDDSMAYAGTWLEEHVEEWQDNFETEEFDHENDEHGDGPQLTVQGVSNYNDCVKALHDYKEGKAMQYQERLEAITPVSPGVLLKKLSQFNQRNRLVKFMIAACDLMKLPFRLPDFVYPVKNHEDEYNDVNLALDMQQNIIWDVDDEYTQRQCEAIDANANEGVYQPFAAISFRKNTKTVDLDRLHEAVKYPHLITELWKVYAAVAEVYKPKKRKKK